MLPRSPWRTRVTAARAMAVALTAAGLVVGVAAPAVADPSDQPGGTSGVLDSRALDELQQRAAEVQTGLQAQQAEVSAAQQALTEAESTVAVAQAVVDDAEGELAGYQDVVAQYASAVYRDGGALTPLTLLLSGGDPGDVLSAMSFLDVVDRHAAEVIGAAEEMRQAALDQRERAQAALEKAQARKDEVAARVAELEDAAAAVTDELDEALSVVDRQLAQLQQEQMAGLRRPAHRGRCRPTAGRPAAEPRRGAAGRSGARRGCRRRSPAGGRAAAAPAHVAAGAAGPDAARGLGGHGCARTALRAGDGRTGLLRLRFPGAVRLRRRGHPAAREPG
jgi:septal ring factor EnvC (AmiA/AmiB activator)